MTSALTPPSSLAAHPASPLPTPLVFDIRGMTCAACSARIEKVLGRTPGVREARVNLALERADVLLEDGADAAVVVEAVERAGYEAVARPRDAAAARASREANAAARRAAHRRTLVVFAISALLTAPFVVQMAAMTLGFDHLMAPSTELVLAAVVQVVAGARFYRGAFAALRGGSANMDVLVALGTTVAFVFSAFMVYRHGGHAAGHLYFEASASVLTLVLFGKLLEERAKAGTTAAVRALMALRPEQATRLTAAGEEIVGVESLVRGDRVLVRPGERIPADGVIEEGESHVDESLVTGESVPVARSSGMAVVTGAINGEGALTITVTAAGDDTTLARITRLVENAQSGKAPVQRLVDRVSAIFVPVVVAVAVATFAGWLLAGAGVEAALVAAVSVLVIACPCALGLATPTALVAGTGAAARAGILIRDIDTLERAGRIDTVVFDKTGTLTAGHPALVAVVPAEGFSRADVLSAAASVQALSEHPLARAVVAAASNEGVAPAPASAFRSVTGRGVEAIVGGARVRVGNRAYLDEAGVPLGTLGDAYAAEETAARTVVAVARDGRPIGLLALADPVRPEAKVAVADLNRRGLTTRMMTGDQAGVARAVATEVGLDGWDGPVKPAEKEAAVRKLMATGATVAMVGDGVNDAPALAVANVGIAMGTGTDVAMETAGVTLMRPDPRLVAAAIDIASATAAKIRQNLFWAFVYNVIGIPLAAFGLLTPTLAGAAMALSSVSVVTNAGLLTRWKARLPDI